MRIMGTAFHTFQFNGGNILFCTSIIINVLIFFSILLLSGEYLVLVENAEHIPNGRIGVHYRLNVTERNSQQQ